MYRKITMLDGIERSIIDIKREGKALFRLVLYAQRRVNKK